MEMPRLAETLVYILPKYRLLSGDDKGPAIINLNNFYSHGDLIS